MPECWHTVPDARASPGLYPADGGMDKSVVFVVAGSARPPGSWQAVRHERVPGRAQTSEPAASGVLHPLLVLVLVLRHQYLELVWVRARADPVHQLMLSHAGALFAVAALGQHEVLDVAGELGIQGLVFEVVNFRRLAAHGPEQFIQCLVPEIFVLEILGHFAAHGAVQGNAGLRSPIAVEVVLP